MEDFRQAVLLEVLVHRKLGFNVVSDPLWPIKERLARLLAPLKQPFSLGLHLNKL